MKVEKLNVENFLGTSSASYELGKTNLFVGPNGSGKSTVMEAIYFLLTGKTASNVILKQGTKQGKIGGTVDGCEIVRGFGEKSGVRFAGKLTTQKSVVEWIQKKTGCTGDSVKVITGAGLLQEMNGAEFAEYLLSNNLIPAEIDFDTLKAICPMQPDVEMEISNYLPAMPDTFTPETIQEAFEYYKEALKTLRRERKENALLAAKNVPMPSVPVVEIERQEAQLAAAKAARDNYDKSMRDWTKRDAARTKIITDIEQLEGRLKTMKRPEFDPTVGPFLRDNERQHRNMLAEIAQDGKSIADNIERTQKALAKLDTPYCPLSDKLVCSTDKTAVRTELEALLADQVKQRETLAERYKERKAKLDDCVARLDKWEQTKKEVEDYDGLCKTLDAKRGAVPDKEEKPAEPAVVSDLEKQGSALRALRNEWADYTTCYKAGKRVEELDEQIRLLEQCEELLHPKKGIREKIIMFALEPIMEHCNARAATLGLNLFAQLKVENGVTIEVSKDRSNWMPLSNASSGEQAIALFLILDCINQLAPLRMMLLDDLDKLDSKAFTALLDILMKPEIQDDYDQIIICSVNHPDILAAASGVEGLTVFDLG